MPRARRVTHACRSDHAALLLKQRDLHTQQSRLKSSNLGHFASLVHAAERVPALSGVLVPFSLPPRADSLLVDLIAARGQAWVKVVARKAQALHLVWAGAGQFGERDLLSQASEYLTCAARHPVNFRTPQVHFAFYSQVTEPMAVALERSGVCVWGERVPVEPSILTKIEAFSSEDSSDDPDGLSHDSCSKSAAHFGTPDGAKVGEPSTDVSSSPSVSQQCHGLPQLSPENNAFLSQSGHDQVEQSCTVSSKDGDNAALDSSAAGASTNEDTVVSSPNHFKSSNRPTSEPASVSPKTCESQTLDIHCSNVGSGSCSVQEIKDKEQNTYSMVYSNKSLCKSQGPDAACGPPWSRDSHTNQDLAGGESNVLSSPVLVPSQNISVSPIDNNDLFLELVASPPDYSSFTSSVPGPALCDRPSSPSSFSSSLSSPPASEQVTPPAGVSPPSLSADGLVSIDRVNLDITTLIALVSSVTNGRCHLVFRDQVLTTQAQEEREAPVLPVLNSFLAGKELLACETAVSSFQAILYILGGPREKERASELLARVQVVPDQPSKRALELECQGRVKDRSKIVFGTGDTLQAITVTSNMGFLRAAQSQGVVFPAFLHPARALTEEKEPHATPLQVQVPVPL